MSNIIDTFHGGAPDLDNTGGTLLTVLILDDEGKKRGLTAVYAAYRAVVKLPEPSAKGYALARMQAEWRVAASGSKLTVREAQRFWGWLTEKEYRA